MALLKMLVGGTIGFGVQLFANAIAKIPLSRKPWMHVIMFSAGAYGGAKLPQLERKLVEDINERRAERGFGPLIGTVGWIRYKEPEA